MLRWCLALLMFAFAGPASATEAAWESLRAGGTVALIRHARAPGTGDPPGFRLEDCSTQRNLSDEGRAQARRLGDTLQSRGVTVARALSSRWCRALDTARLAFGNTMLPFAPLDSFFGDRKTEAEQTRAVREDIARWQGPGVLALVTHQVNITALTGIFPAEGEMIVLRPRADGFDVVGRIVP